MRVDAVLHDDRQVLIAAEVRGLRRLQNPQGGVAARLRPAVAVQVGEQPVVPGAVEVHRAAESRLREGALRPHALPLVGPAGEPGELPLAEQFQAGEVDRRAVVRGIDDVVGPGPQLRDRAERARLALPVFEDREVDTADHEPREIDADPLLHRCGIHRVGQVPGLLPLHHVHVGRRIEVPAVGAVGPLGLPAARSPEVRLAHVVVVGNRDRGPVPDHVAKLEAELEPAHRVLGVPVGLVARKEEEIGIGRPQAGHEFLPLARCPRRVAGEHGHADPLARGRVGPHEPLEHGPLPVPHTVGRGPARVPALDAKVGAPPGVEHLGGRHLLPGVAPLHLEPRHAGLARLQGKELRRQLEHGRAARRLHAHGVEGEGHDLVAGDVEREWRPLRRLRFRPGLVPGLHPPLAGHPAVELRMGRAKRRRREVVVPGRPGRAGDADPHRGDHQDPDSEPTIPPLTRRHRLRPRPRGSSPTPGRPRRHPSSRARARG